MERVLKFYTASWCGACKVLKTVIAEVNNEYLAPAGIPLVYVSLDEESGQREAEALGLLGLPALIIFLDGKKYCDIQARSKREIIRECADVLEGVKA